MTQDEIINRIEAIRTEIWAIECSYDILTEEAKNIIAALHEEKSNLYKELEAKNV